MLGYFVGKFAVNNLTSISSYFLIVHNYDGQTTFITILRDKACV